MTLLLLALSVASATPTLTLISPGRFEEITDTSVFYEPQLHAVRVAGAITGLGPTPPPNWEVRVNGEVATISSFGADAAFSVLVDFNASGPARFWDPYAIVQPIVAQLIDTSTGAVQAVAKTSVYDNRLQLVQIGYAGDVVPDGARVQLNGSGLAALAPVWAEVQPHPDEAALDADLTAAADALPEVGAVIEPVCTPLVDAGIDYASLLAYQAAFAVAAGEHQAFEAALNVAQAVPPPGTVLAVAATYASFCVQHAPEPEDFDLCVRRVDTDPTRMTAADVSDATLGVSDALPSLVGTATLEAPQASATAYLRDLQIRWNGGPVTCLTRPAASIDDDTAADALAAWSTCPEAWIAGTRATSTDGAWAIAVDPVDSALQIASGTMAPAFTLVSPNASADGTCGEPWVARAVEDALLARVPDLEGAISDAWMAREGATLSADALDLVLSPLELGTTEVCDVSTSLSTSTLEVVSGESLRLRYATDAHPSQGLPALFEPRGWMYAAANGGSFSQDGLDPWGVPFDLSYSVTTGFLNQIARARGTALLLGATLHPTWAELGVGVPPGRSPDDEAVLDGRTLGRLVPGLRIAGRSTFTIHVQPAAVPFTSMPNDTAALRPGAAPLAYHVADLRVVLRVHTPKGTLDVAEVALDAYEPGLRLAFANDGRPWLDAAWSAGAPFDTTLVRSLIPGCPLGAPAMAAGAPGCEASLADALSRLITPRIADLVLDAISEVPAPQAFDGAGFSSLAAYADPGSRAYRDRQTYTLYTDLLPPIPTWEAPLACAP